MGAAASPGTADGEDPSVLDSLSWRRMTGERRWAMARKKSGTDADAATDGAGANCRSLNRRPPARADDSVVAAVMASTGAENRPVETAEFLRAEAGDVQANAVTIERAGAEQVTAERVIMNKSGARSIDARPRRSTAPAFWRCAATSLFSTTRRSWHCPRGSPHRAWLRSGAEGRERHYRRKREDHRLRRPGGARPAPCGRRAGCGGVRRGPGAAFIGAILRRVIR